MRVPEAPVHKDRRSILRQNNIRLSWQIFSMEPVSVAQGVKDRPDAHFRLCVSVLNRGHVAAALLLSVNIH
jgi:hypothetical protein